MAERTREARAGGGDLTAMRDGDVARLENIQGMAESFCTWLHAKGEAQMARDDDAAVEKIRQVSGSFNKAARAVRLSMVLKHEVAGLRPLPRLAPAIRRGRRTRMGLPRRPATGPAPMNPPGALAPATRRIGPKTTRMTTRTRSA